MWFKSTNPSHPGEDTKFCGSNAKKKKSVDESFLLTNGGSLVSWFRC
jgi:hypothetical protein